jgi:hypothetical protein
MSKLSDLKAKAIERRPRASVEVFTRGHANTAVYNALPSPLTSLYCLIGSGSIMGLAYFFGDRWKDADGAGRGYQCSMVAMGVMTAISLLALGWRQRKATRIASETGSLEEAMKHSAAGGEPADGAGEAAKMDDLRDEFRRGIDLFTSHGKDFYSFPWYVLVGEPGSGKSEAIRRSELKFPDRMQDKMQGVGGTVSMHWWFTNQAIILDTAGAMLTRPEAASRFQEFLSLLKTHRPDCPINGMILTIPVDSLKVDDADAIERKASGIAAQLGIIQQALDVRFPIYLMISKSDRLPGWREFFDAPGQAKYERQMLGWANPDPLDTPFDPQRIGEAIGQITDRLRMRSLALLSDPIARKPEGRRTDEVDALYAFPGHLRGLTPGLTKYLETIFETGEWSSKPPFFRGVFFTSALQEGSQLDTELAKVLGIPVENLPSEGAFVREKAVFLRDMFLEKIFPEQGLVTRLTSIRKHLRKRLVAFYGITAALVGLLLGWAWLMHSKLEEQMTQEDKAWAAINGTWKNGDLLAVVDVTEKIPTFDSLTKYPTGEKGFDEKERTKILRDILEKTSKPLKFSWAFRPISVWNDYENRRRSAALTVVESSLLKPLVEAARRKILANTAIGANLDKETKDRLVSAFGQLARLESWIAGQSTPAGETDWKDFFQGLTAYVVPNGVALEEPPAVAGAVMEVPKIDPTSVKGTEVKVATAPAGTNLEIQLESEQKFGRMAAVAAQLLAPGGSGTPFTFTGRTWLSEEPGKNGSSLEAAVIFLKRELKQVLDAADQIKKYRKDLAEFDGKWMRAEKGLIEAARKRSPLDKAEALLSDLKSALPPNFSNSGDQALLDSSKLIVALDHAARATQGRVQNPPSGLEILWRLRSDIDKMNLSMTKANPGVSSPEDRFKWEKRRDDLVRMTEAFEALVSSSEVEIDVRIGKLQTAIEEAKSRRPPPVQPPDVIEEKGRETDIICNYLKRFQGRGMENKVLIDYLGQLKSNLSENLKWPLVQESVDRYSQRDFNNGSLEKLFENLKKDEEAFAGLGNEALDSTQAEELEKIFRLLTPVRNVFIALTAEPQIIFPKPDADKALDMIQRREVSGGLLKPSEIKEDKILVPNGFQELTFFHPAVADSPVGRVTVVWRIFEDVAFVARIAENGADLRQRGEPFYPLQEVISKRSLDIAVKIPGFKNCTVTVETKPGLPVASWPSRKDFGLK